MNKAQSYTESTVLKTPRIFNCAGIISVFTVTTKVPLQRLWVLKSPWDKQMPEGIKTQWKEWGADVMQIFSVTIPLRVRAGLNVEMQIAELHTFSDTSLKA